MSLRDLRARLGEQLADVWVLLYDTDRFLSRSKLMPRYENRLRDWRRRLDQYRNDPEVMREVRGEIVAVRKALREEGWELRLGSLDIRVAGFRSDDALSRGFRRMVIALSSSGSIHHIVGDPNHVELKEMLSSRLPTRTAGERLSYHYLWYRLSAGLIQLAGADSEPRESLEELQDIVENRKSDFVKALRRLQ
jgi:hypothetical protein